MTAAAAMEHSSELARTLTAAIMHFEAATVNLTHRAFQEAPINSRLWTDSQYTCLPTPDDQLALTFKVPETTKMLFVLGAQKAGTTFLYNLLADHPGFVQGTVDKWYAYSIGCVPLPLCMTCQRFTHSRQAEKAASAFNSTLYIQFNALVPRY